MQEFNNQFFHPAVEAENVNMGTNQCMLKLISRTVGSNPGLPSKKIGLFQIVCAALGTRTRLVLVEFGWWSNLVGGRIWSLVLVIQIFLFH